MKKILFMSVLIGALLALSGCGSSGSNRTYETTTEPAVPAVPNTGGDALVVTNTGEGNVGMTYTKVSDGSVLVECDGEGGCGDVFIGNEITEGDGDNVTDGDASITGADSCEDGFVWCSIEKKCVVDSGGGACDAH